MKRFLARSRTELLLGAALLVPVLAPAHTSLKNLASTMLDLLPTASAADVPAPGSDEGTWREAFYRLLAENVELRQRLLALGEPAGLVAYDPAYWERKPVRIEAGVLARDASPFRGSIEISAGAREGMREGLPVVVGNRLVGLVRSVGPLTSRVALVTDPGTIVWGEILFGEGAAEAAVSGTGAERLRMERVVGEGLAAGDPVYTGRGLADVPRGLLIGTAVRVEDVDRNGVAEVEVEPAVDAGDLGFVNVLAPPR